MIIFFLLVGFFIAVISAPLRFVTFIIKGFEDPTPNSTMFNLLGIASDLSCMFCLPLAYLLISESNDRLSASGGVFFWGTWISACVAAYFIATYPARIFPFLKEFGLNLLLGAGIAVNLYVGYDLTERGEEGFWFAAVGNGPIILLFLIALMKRYVFFARRLPTAVDALRNSRADVLDYMPAEPDDLFTFKNLDPVEDAAVRILASPLYVRLGVFIVGGFLAVSSGLLLARFLGFYWF